MTLKGLKRFGVLLALLVIGATVQAQWWSYEPALRTSQGVAYAPTYQRQILDVFLPTDDSRLTEAGYPVLFMIHGGGYVAGSKDIMAPVADYFAGQGYAAVTPNYRLGMHPAPIQDLTCALAWVYANAADYRFDLSRLVILGESAGGNAAALLGAHDDLARFIADDCLNSLPDETTFAAVIPYYMYGDMTTCGAACRLLKQATSFYLGQPLYELTMEELRALWGEASPLVWLDGTEPPTLVIHGLDDDIVPLSESELYVERLSEQGVTVETVYIPDAKHGFIERLDTAPSRIAREAVVAFLDRILTGSGGATAHR
ncbi:MAG: alpha/beta hydrolase [Anaerolineae bacterium]|jgi:acetyl esterase/lipase|nr:alpha/beta hydrolase [Anaerolineae bacterium]